MPQRRPGVLDFSIDRKVRGAEFAHMPEAKAKKSFRERIGYYRHILRPLSRTTATGSSWIRSTTASGGAGRRPAALLRPHPGFLVSDWVKSLILVRHGQSEDNLAGRIGGDSHLTETAGARPGPCRGTSSARPSPTCSPAPSGAPRRWPSPW
jgi:hypothetical protein